MTKILLFPGRKTYQKILCDRLREKSWQVLNSDRLETICNILAANQIDLLICDASEGCQDILEILALIRTDQLKTLIVVVGPFANLSDQHLVLESGATEVISRPLSWIEFWLRLKNLNLLQRKEVRPMSQTCIGTHYYDEGLLVRNGQKIRLRLKENKILECLTKYKHRVLNRTELMKFVWESPSDYPSPDTIDVYIRRLRMKLGMNGNSIKTYRGFGYSWEPEI